MTFTVFRLKFEPCGFKWGIHKSNGLAAVAIFETRDLARRCAAFLNQAGGKQ